MGLRTRAPFDPCVFTPSIMFSGVPAAKLLAICAWGCVCAIHVFMRRSRILTPWIFVAGSSRCHPRGRFYPFIVIICMFMHQVEYLIGFWRHVHGDAVARSVGFSRWSFYVRLRHVPRATGTCSVDQLFMCNQMFPCKIGRSVGSPCPGEAPHWSKAMILAKVELVVVVELIQMILAESRNKRR